MENKKVKAKVSSFMVKATRPEDYTVNPIKSFSHVSHCELCGSALDHSFRLIHKDSTEENKIKDLFVGSDCVENFMETYFPLRKEEVMRAIKNTLEKDRVTVFLANNPNIKSVCKIIREYVNKDLLAFANENEVVKEYWNFKYSEAWKKVLTDIKAIERKNYLSAPKTEKIYALVEMIKTDVFKNILLEQKEEKTRSEKLKIKDLDLKSLSPVIAEFYAIYQKIEQKKNDAYSARNSYWKPSPVDERASLGVLEMTNYIYRNKVKKFALTLIPEVY